MTTMIDPKELAGSQAAAKPESGEGANGAAGDNHEADANEPEQAPVAPPNKTLADVVADKLGGDGHEDGRGVVEDGRAVAEDGDGDDTGTEDGRGVLLGLLDALGDEPVSSDAKREQERERVVAEPRDSQPAKQPEAEERATPGDGYGLTAEQQATYAGSIPVIEKVAAAVAAKHLRAIEKRIKAIESRLDDAVKRASFAESYVSTAGKEHFQSRLAGLVPDLQDKMRDPGFKAWLDTNVPGTKIRRRDALREAYNEFDAERAAEILNGFGGGKAATIPAGAAAPAGVGSPAAGRGGKEATVESILAVKSELGSKFASRQIGRKQHMQVTQVLDGFLKRMYKGEKVYVGEIMEAVRTVADKMA